VNVFNPASTSRSPKFKTDVIETQDIPDIYVSLSSYPYATPLLVKLIFKIKVAIVVLYIFASI
jgi:hypothetical protein